jgi:hypothetical protein
MSMAPTDLVCSKCEFKGSNAVVWGDFRYIKGGLEIDLSRTLGWCACCSDFVPIEDFAIKDELLADIDEALEAIKLRAIRWLSFSLLGRTRKDRQDELGRLSVLIALLALIGERKGMEKCLHCGSASVERFDETYSRPNSYASKGTTDNTGFHHPGCGGTFLASVNPIRLNFIFEPRLYSVDGYRLDR